MEKAIADLKAGRPVYFIYDYENVPFSDVVEAFYYSGAPLDKLQISSSHPKGIHENVIFG